MQAILRYFFWVYRYLDKRVMVISDMTRMEDGVLNEEAGAEILATTYNELGLSNKTVIYTSSYQSKVIAEKAIKKRNLRSNNWKVLFTEDQVIKEIDKFFMT
jgi:hypothetical protein